MWRKGINVGSLLSFQHSKQVVRGKRGQILCCAFLCAGVCVLTGVLQSNICTHKPHRHPYAADRVNSAALESVEGKR